MDFNNILVNLGDKPVATLEEAKKLNVPVLTVGTLVTNIIDFIIVACVLYLVVKAVNKMKAEAPAPPPPGPTPDPASAP